jgi:hypothetical protein
MDESTPVIARIYHWLMRRCGAPASLPTPWQELPDGPRVIGPIRDRAAALEIFQKFDLADLVRAGVATVNEHKTPSLIPELFEANFVGIVLHDASGHPAAILTASGGLAPNGPPTIETALADPGVQEQLRQHGVLWVVPDLTAVRILRGLGVPAIPVAHFERDPGWIWRHDGEAVEPDRRWAAYERQLVADALAQEAAEQAPVRPDAAADEGAGAEPATAAPESNLPDKDPDLGAAPESADRPIAEVTVRTGTGPAASRPTIVLAGGSLASLTPSISPAIAAAAGSLIRMRDLGGVELDWIGAWCPDPDFGDRVRFALGHGDVERVRELLTQSALALRPIDDLVESGPAAEPDLLTARDNYIAALTSTRPRAEYDRALSQAQATYTELIEIHLTGPMRDQALAESDPQVRLAGILLADLYGQAFLLAARVQADNLAHTGRPIGGGARRDDDRLTREYRALVATIGRQARDYERARRGSW